jgi:hypothetical protein
MKKLYYGQYNVGNAKYIVTFVDETHLHKDGSLQYGIKTFTNKQLFNQFIIALHKDGYKER